MVDDDVVFVPLGETRPATSSWPSSSSTGNRWGIAVPPERADLLAELDGALDRVLADGRLAAAWRAWLPTLDYPFGESRRDRS